jgi:hypothetical protein
MKNEYFNEREKRLFNYFSKKDDFYKGCYFGETNPIIDNKINKIEKRIVKDFKDQLKKTKDKNRKEELLEFISLYEKPKEEVKKVEETVVPTIVEETVVKNLKRKLKNFLYLRQSLIEKIIVDLFIGVIHSSRLIEANLELLRAGEKRKNFQFIIEEI